MYCLINFKIYFQLGARAWASKSKRRLWKYTLKWYLIICNTFNKISFMYDLDSKCSTLSELASPRRCLRQFSMPHYTTIAMASPLGSKSLTTSVFSYFISDVTSQSGWKRINLNNFNESRNQRFSYISCLLFAQLHWPKSCANFPLSHFIN